MLPRTACGALPVRVRVSSLQRLDEILWRDIRLAQQACESTDLQLRVHWDGAPLCVAPHHNVTAALAKLDETQTLQSSLCFRTRNSGQLRHGPV